MTQAVWAACKERKERFRTVFDEQRAAVVDAVEKCVEPTHRITLPLEHPNTAKAVARFLGWVQRGAWGSESRREAVGAQVGAGDALAKKARQGEQ